MTNTIGAPITNHIQPFWAAVNRYVDACGGDTTKICVARQKAVVDIETTLADIANEALTTPTPGELKHIMEMPLWDAIHEYVDACGGDTQALGLDAEQRASAARAIGNINKTVHAIRRKAKSEIPQTMFAFEELTNAELRTISRMIGQMKMETIVEMVGETGAADIAKVYVFAKHALEG